MVEQEYDSGEGVDVKELYLGWHLESCSFSGYDGMEFPLTRSPCPFSRFRFGGFSVYA